MRLRVISDTFWGICRGEGENHLGKLIMEVRKEIMEEMKKEADE